MIPRYWTPEKRLELIAKLAERNVGSIHRPQTDPSWLLLVERLFFLAGASDEFLEANAANYADVLEETDDNVYFEEKEAK